MTWPVYADEFGVTHYKYAHTDTLPICDYHHDDFIRVNPRPIRDAPLTCIWCLYESTRTKEP